MFFQPNPTKVRTFGSRWWKAWRSWNNRERIVWVISAPFMVAADALDAIFLESLLRRAHRWYSKLTYRERTMIMAVVVTVILITMILLAGKAGAASAAPINPQRAAYSQLAAQNLRRFQDGGICAMFFNPETISLSVLKADFPTGKVLNSTKEVPQGMLITVCFHSGKS